MGKIASAQRTIQVSVANNTVSIVDIAQCLSVLNRRMYRQGMSYYIQSIKCITPAMGVVVRTAPDTWVLHNAWKKGYETWREMQNDANGGEGWRAKGKWADFKVLLDDAGDTAITPIDGASGSGDLYLLGEWIYSNFVYDDAGTSRSPAISLIGSTTEDSHISLIQSYAEARNYPTAGPDQSSSIATGFYAQFHGVGDVDDELMVDIRDDNDNPPYDVDDYPGGASNGDHPITIDVGATTAEFPIANIDGFVAPCGLISIHQQNSGASAATFLITVGIGPYKGVMASRMGQ